MTPGLPGGGGQRGASEWGWGSVWGARGCARSPWQMQTAGGHSGMSLSFIEVASGWHSTGAARGTDADSAGKRWQVPSGRRGLCGLLGCPVSQPLMWVGPEQAEGGGREPQASPLGPVGGAPRLADGVQSVGQGVHLILDAVQGAPDGVGTVQHVDGQCVWVKLHREGTLDAGGVAPVGGGPPQGPSVTSGEEPECGGPSPPSQRAQSPRTFLSLRPPKLILSSHPDKSGDQGLLQGLGAVYSREDRPFSKRTSTRHSIPPCSFPREAQPGLLLQEGLQTCALESPLCLCPYARM